MLEAARRVWYGHGPAGSFFASGTILLLKSWKGAAESDRTSAASALLLLPVHAHPDPASVPVCVHFSGSWEHAGAAEKGHSRVRHFYGVVTFPVVKRAARGVGRSRGPSTTDAARLREHGVPRLGGRWAAPGGCARVRASIAAAFCGTA